MKRSELLTRIVLLERACTALAALVRDEFPDDYSLSECAYTWGDGITPEQIDAIRVLENDGLALSESHHEVIRDASKAVDVEPSKVGD